jgi:hypothetical protein
MVWRQMLPAALLTGLVAAPVQALLVRARLMPALGRASFPRTQAEVR